MKHLLALFLVFFLLVPPAVALKETGTFVAVICSHDLMIHWNGTFPTDYLISPNTWDELDAVLDDIIIKAHGQPIFLDYMVHGDETGLQIRWSHDGREGTVDNATMGYVLNHTWQHLRNRRAMICFESCYAGRAYKNTIRGWHSNDPEENVEDYQGVPSFPVYGTGDDHDVIGQPMYLQYVHRVRRWWVDLRVYDNEGIGKPLSPKQMEIVVTPDLGGPYQQTTLDMFRFVMWYRNK